MVDDSLTASTPESSTPESQSGYNKIYQHQWRTCTYALPSLVRNQLNVITDSRSWGWHFIPHADIDYQLVDWYTNQTLVLSFAEEYDLIQAKLEVASLL